MWPVLLPSARCFYSLTECPFELLLMLNLTLSTRAPHHSTAQPHPYSGRGNTGSLTISRSRRVLSGVLAIVHTDLSTWNCFPPCQPLKHNSAMKTRPHCPLVSRAFPEGPGPRTPSKLRAKVSPHRLCPHTTLPRPQGSPEPLALSDWTASLCPTTAAAQRADTRAHSAGMFSM